jgi:FkbM family methyltransferase
MFSFCDILDEPPPVVRIIDAGAAEYETDPYARLSEQGLCEVIGFEPNPENCARRNASARPGHRYLPYALGDGRRRRFYECQNPLTSSLYRPNAAMLAKFSRLALPVVAEHDIQTYRLDDLSEIQDIDQDVDYVKLDVQGAELDIIMGAPNLLAQAIAVHTEVEFIPMYEEQPLFGDIDVALRKSGFWLHKLDGIRGRVIAPLMVNNDPYAPLSQILWADAAVYVRSFMAFDRVSPPKLLKLALVLHEIYGSFDLAALALSAYDAQMRKNLTPAYLAKLTGK